KVPQLKKGESQQSFEDLMDSSKLKEKAGTQMAMECEEALANINTTAPIPPLGLAGPNSTSFNPIPLTPNIGRSQEAPEPQLSAPNARATSTPALHPSHMLASRTVSMVTPKDGNTLFDHN